MSMLSFIHLSDIHFQKYSGDAYDLDADLRNVNANLKLYSSHD